MSDDHGLLIPVPREYFENPSNCSISSSGCWGLIGGWSMLDSLNDTSCRFGDGIKFEFVES